MGRDYKDFVRSLIYLRTREKLILIVPLVSGFSYQIDESNEDFKAIISLFDLRNALIHAKQHWHPAIVLQEGKRLSLRYENAEALDFYSSDTPKLAPVIYGVISDSSSNSLSTSIIWEAGSAQGVSLIGKITNRENGLKEFTPTFKSSRNLG
jgi:hypothetical protein